MNYIHKLKFTNESAFNAIDLKDYKIESIFKVGTITKPATFDEEGIQLTPATTIEGYHVDINAFEEITVLKPYCLDAPPNNPAHGYDWASRPFTLVLKTENVMIE